MRTYIFSIKIIFKPHIVIIKHYHVKILNFWTDRSDSLHLLDDTIFPDFENIRSRFLSATGTKFENYFVFSIHRASGFDVVGSNVVAVNIPVSKYDKK